MCFMFKWNQKNSNVFIALLSALKVEHTVEFSNSYYNQHPHKDNLLGLSQMLSEYGIENIAVKIDENNKYDDISQLSVPFIAQVDGDFVVVSNTANGRVDYVWRNNNITLPIAKFCLSWSGVTLLAETTERSGEPNYKENYRKELLFKTQKTIILIAIACIIVSAFVSEDVYSSNWWYILLLLFNFIGVLACYLLIMKQMHINNT